MNIPKIINDLIEAQNSADSLAYANCFSTTAVVLDEGKTYNGKAEIRDWIEKANQKYQTVMKPLKYSETAHTLKAEISGTFPGSPLVITYSYTIENDLIQSLKID